MTIDIKKGYKAIITIDLEYEHINVLTLAYMFKTIPYHKDDKWYSGLVKLGLLTPLNDRVTLTIVGRQIIESIMHKKFQYKR